MAPSNSPTNQDGVESGSAIDRVASLLHKEDEDHDLDDDVYDEPEGEDEDLGDEESEAPDDGGDASDVELAKVIGFTDDQLDVDEDGNVNGIIVNVNGQKSVVSASDLIAGYQTNKAITQKAQLVAEEKRQFDGLKGQAISEYTQRLQLVDGLAQQLKNALMGDYSQVDWNRLRAEKPGEYAALMQDVNSRQQQIDGIIASIGIEAQRFQEQISGISQQQYQGYLREQLQDVVNRNPSWRDPAVMERDMSILGKVATQEYGISPQEFAHLADARHIEILKDAVAYRTGKKLTQEKISKAPSFQKSGSGSRRGSTKLDRLITASKKAKGSQKRGFQTSAIAELLLNGQ